MWRILTKYWAARCQAGSENCAVVVRMWSGRAGWPDSGGSCAVLASAASPTIKVWHSQGFYTSYITLGLGQLWLSWGYMREYCEWCRVWSEYCRVVSCRHWQWTRDESPGSSVSQAFPDTIVTTGYHQLTWRIFQKVLAWLVCAMVMVWSDNQKLSSHESLYRPWNPKKISKMAAIGGGGQKSMS